jgi:6-phosphogluconolactonase
MDDSPKPPPGRMSSSLSLMQTAAAAVLLFAGEGQREAYAKFNDEGRSVADCPARLVLVLDDAAVFTDIA